MGKLFDSIDDGIETFLRSQKLFFVATAPSGGEGHLNLSPKGLDTLRVLGPRTLAYLDYAGSGAETLAHLRDDGRIVLMFCAFEGAPKIVRFHGRGQGLEPQDAEYAELRARFPAQPPARAIIRVEVTRISDSCGFGVPLFEYRGERTQLPAWAEKKGEAALLDYQRQKNAVSIDGLPALRWVGAAAEPHS